MSGATCATCGASFGSIDPAQYTIEHEAGESDLIGVYSHYAEGI